MKRFIWCRKREKGFTLVELMVVFAVIAILAAVAAPSVVNWLPSYRLKKASRELYSNLQLAKSTAIRNSEDCAVVFNGPTNEYFVCTEDGADDDWTTMADNTVLRMMDFRNLKDNISYGTGNATINPFDGGALPGLLFTSPIVFTPRGYCTDQNGNPLQGFAYIQNNENSTFAVSVVAGGAIRLWKWHSASASWD